MTVTRETKPRERPILFNDEMVRAVLSGRKTQTRRVVKPQPTKIWDCFIQNAPWQIRDLLWVRECFAIETNYNIDDAANYPPPFNDGRPVKWESDECDCEHWYQPHYRATDPTPELAYDDGGDEPTVRWRPSIHMPRWVSRITLRITNVRVERLQDISEEDARAEGVDVIPSAPAALSHRTAFAGLWNRTQLARKDPGGLSWNDNPWVWVIEFERATNGGE